MKYVTPASFAPGPSLSAGIRRATAASRNATSAALRNMYFSLFAAPCACCCAPAAAGIVVAPSAPADFRKRRQPPDSSKYPPRGKPHGQIELENTHRPDRRKARHRIVVAGLHDVI